MAIAHTLTLASTVLVGIFAARDDRWSLGELAMIGGFTVASELSSVEIESATAYVSGSFLGLVLAAVVLGGAPAAIVGVLTMLVAWVHARYPLGYLVNNLITYAAFPMLAGTGVRALTRIAGISPHDPNYYLLVFATFVVALGLNFIGIFAYQCHLDGGSLRAKFVETFMPVLASELFAAILTVLAVYAANELGTVGVAGIGIVLLVFQYLVGELLKSKQRSDELKRVATTDDLTGLPNREAFRERLSREVEECQQAGAGFGVILMDLDHFKEINDTLGHHHGDLVLRDLGPRLAACIEQTGMVARLGGDEFAILPDRRTTNSVALGELAARLLDCVRTPITVEGLSLELGASLGASRFPLDGTDESTLIRRADVAMYAAKETHRGFCLYSTDQDRDALQRLSVTTDIRRALGAGEIVVHYQPIVELPGQRICGAEGLVRWQHPVRGLLPPGAFIDTIEQTGLIAPLTRYVLDSAVEECARWHAGGESLFVAVNLSVRDLLDQGLPRAIEQTLNRWGLDPGALKLEITESMLMSDPERALETISRINALGVSFAVDDFGTGYSSLAYLRRLPIDELKIDRSFVSPMLADHSDLVIVRSTINLAHDLGLRIVAEGVEDAATAECLERLGCDLAQGYHFGRPLAPDRFSHVLRGEPVKAA